ncbi:phage tail protein [Paraferrimonas sp. SM1919]|uniref:phage tail protein n=1 Tax=Paraferrimonas sp. SM1919 TaxID=2662263 RepID=UPI0013D3C0EA|nr:tail fiber protein [Paraferrimonas sp. SM1919]
MSNPFIGEIQLLPYTFTPRFWMSCDGQLLPIEQFTTLFALIGTIYGGNGRTTFGLPNLNGRVPMGAGRGPGLTLNQLGEQQGYNTISLTASQVPAHSHTVNTERSSSGSFSTDPTGKFIGASRTIDPYSADDSTQVFQYFHDSTVADAGDSTPHENRQPFLALRYCIATEGIFPPRN